MFSDSHLQPSPFPSPANYQPEPEPNPAFNLLGLMYLVCSHDLQLLSVTCMRLDLITRQNYRNTKKNCC